jgi:hypothetical protein
MRREDLEQSSERLKQGIKRMVSSSVIILVVFFILTILLVAIGPRYMDRDELHLWVLAIVLIFVLVNGFWILMSKRFLNRNAFKCPACGTPITSTNIDVVLKNRTCSSCGVRLFD